MDFGSPILRNKDVPVTRGRRGDGITDQPEFGYSTSTPREGRGHLATSPDFTRTPRRSRSVEKTARSAPQPARKDMSVQWAVRRDLGRQASRMLHIAVKKEMEKSFQRGKEPVPDLYRHFRGHHNTVNGLYFHPWRDLLLSCSSDGHILSWSFKNMDKRALRFEGHTAPVNDVAFSRDHGDLMLSCSDDTTMRIWVPIIQGEVRTIKGHSAPVRSIAFKPGGSSEFISGSDDKTIKLWDIEHSPRTCRKMLIHAYEFLGSWNFHTNWVRSVRFHPEGNLVVTASDDRSVGLVDIRIPNRCAGVKVDSDLGFPVYAEFNPIDPKYFGLATDDAFLIYDIRNSGYLIQSYNDIHTDRLNGFTFHPSGDFAYTISEDGSMKILDIVEGRPLFTLYGAHSGLEAVHTNYSGSYVASGGSDKDILVWETVLLPYKEEEFSERGMVDEEGGSNEVENNDFYKNYWMSLRADGKDQSDSIPEGEEVEKKEHDRRLTEEEHLRRLMELEEDEKEQDRRLTEEEHGRRLMELEESVSDLSEGLRKFNVSEQEGTAGEENTVSIAHLIDQLDPEDNYYSK